MKVTKNACIQWIEQTQKKIMIDDRSDRAKYVDIMNAATGPSPKNQDNNGIDEYINDSACTTENERYELAEAKNTVKYIKHFVKSTKHIIDQNPAKPKDYDKWTDEEQYEHIVDNVKTYMPNIPDSLLFVISAALHRGDCGRSSTDRPPWLDMDKFRRGQKFIRDYFSSFLIANILSLFSIFAFQDGLKPLIFSRQSHTPYLAFKRYLSTACRIRNWMTEDPWTVGTQAHKNVQTVRRMHRAMRLKLCEHDNEEIDIKTKILDPWCSFPDRETILEDFSSCPYPTVENGCFHLLVKPKGLNQSDMGGTQFAFIGMVLLYPHEFGIHVSDEDMEAFCHTWRGIGYLLGIEDQYNFCRGSVEEIKQRSRDFIEVWVRPYLRQVTPEWEHMMRCVTEGTKYYANITTFKVLLLFFADILNINMPRTRSTLTYFERLHLMLYRFIFRHAIRIRIVREYINRMFNKLLNKAIKFSPEKHENLKKRSARKVTDFRVM